MTNKNGGSSEGNFFHGNGDGTFTTPLVIPYVVGGEAATIGINSAVADLKPRWPRRHITWG
jgi:hypothetical protein